MGQKTEVWDENLGIEIIQNCMSQELNYSTDVENGKKFFNAFKW